MKVLSAPTWLITYADLLTLLVCFFVTLLSNGVVSAGNIRPSLQQNASGIKGLVDSVNIHDPGTQLANPTAKHSLQLEIGSTDFISSRLSPNAESKARIWLGALNAVSLAELVLESCDSYDTRLSKALWRASVVTNLVSEKAELKDKLLVELKNTSCGQDRSQIRITAR